MSDTGGKSFTIGGFYSMKNKRKCIGIERSIENVVKKHQREKIPKSYPSRILGPCTKWQTFFRQQDAFTACRSLDRDLHVFAFESESFEGNKGQRMYLVASYPVFWNYYKQMELEQRHHYEVIPQGSVSKLYFDLEYDLAINPGRDGNRMVDILIQIMCAALQKEFNVKCSKSDVLDLEASTIKKFSRHLIFQMGNMVFKNNIHAGNFVVCVMSRLLDELHMEKRPAADDDISGCECTETSKVQKPATALGAEADDEKLSTIGTSDKDKGPDSLTDSLDSADKDHEKVSKEVEKERARATGDQAELPADIGGADTGTDIEAVRAEGDSLAEVFQEFSQEDLREMMVKNKHGEDVLFCDLGVYTKNRNFRLYLSSKMNKNNPLRLSDQNKYTPPHNPRQSSEDEAVFYHSLVTNVVYSNSTRVLTFGDDMDKQFSLPRGQRSKAIGKERIDGYNRSPYPEVDEYISSIITQNGNGGVIRHWTYFHLGELLLYEISHFRYCHNIGRPHKSNNIMYIVDLRKGVFYQKCHDPECHMQNYKSGEWPLPRETLPESYFDDDDDLNGEDMDDEELLNSTLELEKQYMCTADGDAGEHARDELEDGSDEYLLEAAEQMENG